MLKHRGGEACATGWIIASQRKWKGRSLWTNIYNYQLMDVRGDSGLIRRSTICTVLLHSYPSSHWLSCEWIDRQWSQYLPSKSCNDCHFHLGQFMFAGPIGAGCLWNKQSGKPEIATPMQSTSIECDCRRWINSLARQCPTEHLPVDLSGRSASTANFGDPGWVCYKVSPRRALQITASECNDQ